MYTQKFCTITVKSEQKIKIEAAKHSAEEQQMLER
jgi:hypothetical protein